jgi:hypothetical protein
MTVAEIEWAIAVIAQAGIADKDDEVAHILEDELHGKVLDAIGGGAPNGPELARAALKSMTLDFARWCA